MKIESDIRDAFKARGLPLTHQRRAVYKELAARTDHPSAESLHEALKTRYPSLSLATVYKTLQTLQGLGLIARIASPTAQARYDARVETHHHAACTACGCIGDVFDSRLDHLPRPKTAGFRIAGHSVHFYGLCARCARPAESQDADVTRRHRHD